MTEDLMIERVKHEVAQALGRPLTEVRDDSLIRKDLGAESIDLIDLTFRFEKALGRPLSEQEVFRSSRGDGDLSVGEIASTLGSLQKMSPHDA